MITAAENAGWPGDVAIGASAGTGLPIASIVRTAKIATIEASAASLLGRLPSAAWKRVTAELSALLPK
jgi:mRNA interferase MazF